MIELLQEGQMPDKKLLGRCGECGALVRCDESDTANIPAQFGFGFYTPARHKLACPTPGCAEDIAMEPDTHGRRILLGGQQ